MAEAQHTSCGEKRMSFDFFFVPPCNNILAATFLCSVDACCVDYFMRVRITRILDRSVFVLSFDIQASAARLEFLLCAHTAGIYLLCWIYRLLIAM